MLGTLQAAAAGRSAPGGACTSGKAPPAASAASPGTQHNTQAGAHHKIACETRATNAGLATTASNVSEGSVARQAVKLEADAVVQPGAKRQKAISAESQAAMAAIAATATLPTQVHNGTR